MLVKLEAEILKCVASDKTLILFVANFDEIKI